MSSCRVPATLNSALQPWPGTYVLGQGIDSRLKFQRKDWSSTQNTARRELFIKWQLTKYKCFSLINSHLTLINSQVAVESMSWSTSAQSFSFIWMFLVFICTLISSTTITGHNNWPIPSGAICDGHINASMSICLWPNSRVAALFLCTFQLYYPRYW